MGHPKCFDIIDICVYRLDNNNNLIPCGTGDHLEDCETFECNMKFKCCRYYCIPYAYMCIGKWDCPEGYDEVDDQKCGNSRPCEGMFKCKLLQICLHPSDVCDKSKDCP